MWRVKSPNSPASRPLQVCSLEDSLTLASPTPRPVETCSLGYPVSDLLASAPFTSDWKAFLFSLRIELGACLPRASMGLSLLCKILKFKFQWIFWNINHLFLRHPPSQIEVVTLRRFYYFNQHIVPIYFVQGQFSFDLHMCRIVCHFYRISRREDLTDHLKFNSQFECGNLRKVIQVGHWEGYIQSVTNRWFTTVSLTDLH